MISFTLIGYSQEVNCFYDILKQSTKIPKTNLRISMLDGNSRTVSCVMSTANHGNKKIEKKGLKRGSDYLFKLNDFLTENDFNINYTSDTLIVIYLYDTVNPTYPFSINVVSNKDTISINTFPNEYLKSEEVIYHDGLFHIIRKDNNDELLEYVREYGEINISDNPWKVIDRYVICNGKLKSQKSWRIPFCHEPERWMRDLKINK